MEKGQSKLSYWIARFFLYILFSIPSTAISALLVIGFKKQGLANALDSILVFFMLGGPAFVIGSIALASADMMAYYSIKIDLNTTPAFTPSHRKVGQYLTLIAIIIFALIGMWPTI